MQTSGLAFETQMQIGCGELEDLVSTVQEVRSTRSLASRVLRPCRGERRAGGGDTGSRGNHPSSPLQRGMDDLVLNGKKNG